MDETLQSYGNIIDNLSDKLRKHYKKEKEIIEILRKVTPIFKSGAYLGMYNEPFEQLVNLLERLEAEHVTTSNQSHSESSS